MTNSSVNGQITVNDELQECFRQMHEYVHRELRYSPTFNGQMELKIKFKHGRIHAIEVVSDEHRLIKINI